MFGRLCFSRRFNELRESKTERLSSQLFEFSYKTATLQFSYSVRPGVLMKTSQVVIIVDDSQVTKRMVYGTPTINWVSIFTLSYQGKK